MQSEFNHKPKSREELLSVVNVFVSNTNRMKRGVAAMLQPARHYAGDQPGMAPIHVDIQSEHINYSIAINPVANSMVISDSQKGPIDLASGDLAALQRTLAFNLTTRMAERDSNPRTRFEPK